MKKHLLLSLIFIFTLNANPIDIGTLKTSLNPIPLSSYFFDINSTLNYDEIKQTRFLPTNNYRLTYPSSFGSNIWMKIELENSSSKAKEIILEFQQPHIENIYLYDEKKQLYHDGFFHENSDHTLNMTFKLRLKAKEVKDYYIQVNSSFATIRVEIEIYSPEYFHDNELTYQAHLFILYGGMIILILFNFLTFFMSKERAYLYYVVFSSIQLYHQFLKHGIVDTYITNLTPYMLSFYMPLITMILLFFILFTNNILDYRKFPKMQKINNYLIVILSIYTVYAYLFETLINHKILIIYLFIYVYYIWQGIYFYFFKKIKSVKYHALGWTIFWIASILYALNDRGVIDLRSAPFIYDYAMLFQMFMFALALSEKINSTRREKELNDKKLIHLQESQKNILKEEVAKQTKEIQHRLHERESLLQELNHRVKNNMQIIISMLRMQADQYGETEKEIVQIAENRIRSMLSVHELLYSKKEDTVLSGQEYLTLLIKQVSLSYAINAQQLSVEIEDITLEMQRMVLIGFVLNELLSNAIKHARREKSLFIEIKLYQEGEKIILLIHDNGEQYEITKEGLGTLFVDAVVDEQLKGNVTRHFEDGYLVQVTI